jgi:hypothetical protein
LTRSHARKLSARGSCVARLAAVSPGSRRRHPPGGMAVLAISDLIIASTLAVNGLAVLNYKLSPTVEGSDNVKDRVVSLVSSLRVFRTLLAGWNLLVVVLMILWFS